MTASKTNVSLILDVLEKANVRLVASLPDDWVAPLIKAVSSDERFIYAPVNREEAAVGLCSGSFFGGIGSVAVMGASGLMTCIYAITKVNYQYEIPLVLFTTLRGDMHDLRTHQVANGVYMLPILDTLNMPYIIVDSREKISDIYSAFAHARVINRCVVVAFTRSVLRDSN